MKDAVLIVLYLALLGVVTWLCEKFRPAVVLGGLLLLVWVLT